MTVISAMLAIVMLIGLVGCGDSEKKQEVISKHTEVALAFNDVAALINENKDFLDSDIVDTYQQMSALLNQYTEILQGDAEIEDSKYDEMIEWFGSVKDWVAAVKDDVSNTIGQ